MHQVTLGLLWPTHLRMAPIVFLFLSLMLKAPSQRTIIETHYVSHTLVSARKHLKSKIGVWINVHVCFKDRELLIQTRSFLALLAEMQC